MGKPVTLDSDDVLALLVAAEALGKVEDHIKARKDDVQVDSIGGVEGMRERLKTVNRAWNDAITEREPLEGPTPQEVDALYYFSGSMGPLADDQPAPDIDMISRLRKKRLLVAGTVHRLIKWGDKSQTQTEVPGELAYKVTPRGMNFL